jgi:hypothetical protein
MVAHQTSIGSSFSFYGFVVQSPAALFPLSFNMIE